MLTDVVIPDFQGHDTVIVVVMEFCDLGSLLRAVTKKAFKPHGKWSYHTTYVRLSLSLTSGHRTCGTDSPCTAYQEQCT